MSRLRFVIAVLFLFLCFFGNSLTINIPAHGYIINEKSDTIFGIIQLSQLEQTSGAVKLNGFEQESLYSRVLFKGKKDNSFRIFYPENILGFGFTYKKEFFSFKRFTGIHNSIFKEENNRLQFLGLIYKGTIELYKYMNFYDNLHINTEHKKYVRYYHNTIFTANQEV